MIVLAANFAGNVRKEKTTPTNLQLKLAGELKRQSSNDLFCFYSFGKYSRHGQMLTEHCHHGEVPESAQESVPGQPHGHVAPWYCSEMHSLISSLESWANPT